MLPVRQLDFFTDFLQLCSWVDSVADSGEMLTLTDHLPVFVSVKGETLCSVKDFRINIFIPGDEDMVILTLESAASNPLVDKPSTERLQQQGAPLRTQQTQKNTHYC